MSKDLTGSDDEPLLSGNRSLIVGVGVGLALIVLVGLFLGLIGFTNVLGAIFFLVSMAVYLAVVALFLWLLYRVAVGVERIADAQERMVRTNEIRARNDGSTRPDRE